MAKKADPIPVAVAGPVKNEEANLAKCLERLDRFAEVVVIDSDSRDATKDIARSFGAKVINFEWDGRYPKKRNWMLLKVAHLGGLRFSLIRVLKLSFRNQL